MTDDDAPDLGSPRDGIVILAILVEGGLVLLALALGWLFERPPLTYFALDWKGVAWGLLGAVPVILGFLVLNRWPVGPLRSIQRFTDDVIRPLMRPCTVVDLLGISCLAGLGEEMLFRGFLQDALAVHVTAWVAILIAGCIFGLLHAVTVSYAVLAAAMGVYLGWVYRGSGNLLAPVVTHAAYDFAVLLWLMRGPGAPPADEEEVEADEE